MNLINVTDRLPPAPPHGGTVPYPVIVKPRVGYHRGVMEGVTWDGARWHGTDDAIVQWADPIAPTVVAPPVQVAPVEDVDATYTINLIGFLPEAKMAVIKLVRELTGLGLGESKAAVEKASDATPILLKAGLSLKDANAVMQRLIEAKAGAARVMET